MLKREKEKSEGDRLDPILMGVEDKIKWKSKLRVSVINSSTECRRKGQSPRARILSASNSLASLGTTHSVLLSALLLRLAPQTGFFSSRTIGEVRSWSLTRARRYRPDEQPRRLRRHLRRADAPPTRAGFTNRFQIFQHNEADCYPKIPPHAYTLSSSNKLSIATCSRLYCRPSYDW